jgi:hypothetical protein
LRRKDWTYLPAPATSANDRLQISYWQVASISKGSNGAVLGSTGPILGACGGGEGMTMVIGAWPVILYDPA